MGFFDFGLFIYRFIYSFIVVSEKKDKVVSVSRLLPNEIHAIIKHLTFTLSGEAKEFTGPLKQYEQECVIRIEVAGKSIFSLVNVFQ